MRRAVADMAETEKMKMHASPAATHGGGEVID